MGEDLPRLVLIADRFTRPAVADRALAAVEAGVPWVQLRDHEAAADRFPGAARSLAARLREAAPGVRVSVNLPAGVDPALAAELGAGLHVGARGPAVAALRRHPGAGVLLGFSAHDAAEARSAVEDGADYLFFSPVYPTTSKPGHPGAGTDALRAACTAAGSVPVFALGGVTPGRVRACVAAGARGVAVLSGLLDADDVGDAAAAYLEALRPADSRHL